jgi:predicted enzyme related to lactoylglutathione lyase
MMELSTTNQDDAKAFYTSLFGWSYTENPSSPVGTYTMFRIGKPEVASVYTQLKDQTEAGIPPHWDLYVSVASADECVKKAAELGGRLFCPPFDIQSFGRMAVIGDPTGAVICIWEAKTDHGITLKNEPGCFCWADLSTPNQEAAEKFYTSLFGWTTVPGEGGYLHLKNGEEFIGGILPANHLAPGVPPHWMGYFQVSDCATATAKARELGGTVCVEPMPIGNVGRMSVVADRQGAGFALFEMTHPG